MSVVRAPEPGEYLGRGPGFPFVPLVEGRLPVVAGPDAVAQALVTILDTEPGERLMRPGFGCPLRSYLMEPNSAALRGRMAADIRDALVRWEPRVHVEAVEVLPTDDPAAVLITVRYVHVRDRRAGTLVHPFSLR